MSNTDINQVVAELKKAGAPQSQIDNAIQMAKDAPEQPGAGVPYEYPPESEEKKATEDSENSDTEE